MKKFLASLTFIILALSAAGQGGEIHVFAHRGCWSKAEAAQEKLAISNGITYLLTDRILPFGKRKKIKTR